MKSVKVPCEECGMEIQLAVGVPATLICSKCGSPNIRLPKEAKTSRLDAFPPNMYIVTMPEPKPVPSPEPKPVPSPKPIGDEGNKFPIQDVIGNEQPQSPPTKPKSKPSKTRKLKPRKTKKRKTS